MYLLSKSHPQLLRLFRKFNTKYFDGKLPEPIIHYAHIPEIRCFGVCEHNGKQFVITIDPQHATSRATRHLTVLHELVHVKLWPSTIHGRKFHDEMLRLANAGALKAVW